MSYMEASRNNASARKAIMMEVKFVDLEGTEKQIQYAEMIRQTNIKYVIRFCEASKARYTSKDENVTAIAQKAIDKAFRRLTIQNSAKWWIENKDHLDSKVQGWFIETIKAEMSK